jgi:hypothetical protein
MSFAGLGELRDPDGAAPREKLDRSGAPVGKNDFPVLDVDRSFHPSPVPALADSPVVLGRRDPVYTQETEFAKQPLMMSAP